MHDLANADQGIVFIAADGTKIKVEMVGRNKPGDLIFMMPDTSPPGTTPSRCGPPSKRTRMSA